MDREALRELTHDAGNSLNLSNIAYKQWVFRYTFLELEKDLGSSGDVTTKALFVENNKIRARVVANTAGIVAGLQEIEYFLVSGDAQFRPRVSNAFSVDFKLKDGDLFSPGQVVLEIEAGVQDLLAVERVMLNLLTRMSNVATFTKRVVESVKDFDVLIAPTRKTLWGLLDKRAVSVGGGGTHRLNLSDAVIVKDNHLDLLERDFEKVLERIMARDLSVRFVELEVENVDEALRAAEVFVGFLSKGLERIGVIMMDNMSVADIKEALGRIKDAGFYDNLLFEASGGIGEESVLEYAASGVDVVSMGCLTGGVSGVDFGLEVDDSSLGIA